MPIYVVLYLVGMCVSIWFFGADVIYKGNHHVNKVVTSFPLRGTPTKRSITQRLCHLKGQCHEIFCFWFFYESVSPQPQSIPLGLFRIFSKIRGDIRKSRCTNGVNDTGGKLPPVSTKSCIENLVTLSL